MPEYRDDVEPAPWNGVRFRDRAQAGARLADELRDYAGRDDVLVLALPRGGVPVGASRSGGAGAIG
jgi:predicted phosphoribosyltransferase